jgi:hypothetical protein
VKASHAEAARET